LAVKTTLRGEMHQFYYKWYFISAQQDNAVVNKNTLVIRSRQFMTYLFHELDRLDYDLFSKVNGFEIVLKKNQKKLTRPRKR
jgi:hypothetical protein